MIGGDLAVNDIDVMQVFYARDNKTKGMLKVVLEGKRKIIGVDGVTDEEDYRGY